MSDVDFRWQVQQAKQRLSEVLRAAESDGPQFVTRHGKDVAVVISIEDFHRMHEGDEPKSALDALTSGPELNLTDDEMDAVNHRDRTVDSDREIPFVVAGWE